MINTLPNVKPISGELRAEALEQWNDRTKPIGSLGRLEQITADLCAIQGSLQPVTSPRAIVLFAADHGVARLGVSAYPQEVTRQMAANFVGGGAAINVLSRYQHATLEVVDVGICGDPVPGVLYRRIREGTRNFLESAAMTSAEVDSAIAVGLDRANAAAANGAVIVVAGEMGIANTAAAAALLCLLTGCEPSRAVGRGTGVDDKGLKHKQQVVQQAITHHEACRNDPQATLCAVGGLEIAALCGFYIGAAANKMMAIVDGFICTVAALAACRFVPTVRDYLQFAHCSAEQGHALALEAMDAQPLLALDMRLGEASGAALALSLVDASVLLYLEMATFSKAGVSTAEQP